MRLCYMHEVNPRVVAMAVSTEMSMLITSFHVSFFILILLSFHQLVNRCHAVYALSSDAVSSVVEVVTLVGKSSAVMPSSKVFT